MLWLRGFADADDATPHVDTLTLPFELRQRSRLRARLDGGEEVALLLPRGHVLRGGDRLLSADGRVVQVRAADEEVSTVRVEAGGADGGGGALALMRAAYHLGNRHVALQVGEGFVRYQHDHVLDAMVRALGLDVAVEMAGFEPEGGAYGGGHGHSHSHGGAEGREGAHEHAHAHAHAHGNGHGHGHGSGSGRGHGHGPSHSHFSRRRYGTAR